MNRFVFFHEKIPFNQHSLTEVLLILDKPYIKKKCFSSEQLKSNNTVQYMLHIQFSSITL